MEEKSLPAVYQFHSKLGSFHIKAVTFQSMLDAFEIKLDIYQIIASTFLIKPHFL